jgi:hypothetical protein
MMRDLHVTDNASRIGFYSGLVVSYTTHPCPGQPLPSNSPHVCRIACLLSLSYFPSIIGENCQVGFYLVAIEPDAYFP